MINQAVPILMYHQIAPRAVPSFRKYAVTPGMFATQMGWLARAGYTSITLDQLVDHRIQGSPLPRRPVIITFDDGFQECLAHALPILQARSFTAIFYLVAGLMGRPSAWLVPERGVAFPLADWTEARAIEAAGCQWGAHTLSHPRLADLDLASCRAELHGGRSLLQERLEREVLHLAYPFGSYNAAVRALAAEAGYRTACSVRIGLSNGDDDLLALHRVPVIGQDSLFDFICRLHTARPVGEMAQRALDALRRRLPATAGTP